LTIASTSQAAAQSWRTRAISDYYPLAATTFFFTIFNIQILSLILPLMILAVSGLCVLHYHRQLLRDVAHMKVVLIFPAIVLLSATWSDVPSVSIWYGIQLAITILAGIVISITASARDIVLGIFYAMIIVTVASLISGQTGPSAVGPVLIGVTGSKDAMGFVGLTLFAAALSVAVDPGQPRAARLSTIIFLPLGALVAMSVQATTSALAVFAFAAAFFGFMTFKPFNSSARWALIAIAAVLGFFAFVAFANSGLSFDRILSALNKDQTLTGRTVLWEWADDWIDKAPILGHGYKAFWLGGSNDSLSLLSMFGLSDGRSFQFHNTYREILVDLGWVGLIALLAAGLTFLYFALFEAIYSPSSTSAFFASILLLLVARSPFETIILVFYPYTVLFYVCGIASMLPSLARKRRRIVPARSNDMTTLDAETPMGAARPSVL
jgi:exopolysaccharide production protein ExoQ